VTIYQEGYQHLYKISRTDNSKFSRIDKSGQNTRPGQKFQLPGLEKDPEVQRVFEQEGFSKILAQLAAAQRKAFALPTASSHAQFDPSETLLSQIKTLVNACRKVPLFSGEKSGYKDLLTALARVTLGELLCEVFLSSGAAEMGCSSEMYDAGLRYIAEREKTVNSRAKHSSSKGSAYGTALGQNLRPNVTDFLRCGLTAVCKKADSWRDQAAFTNFVAVFVFSIVKGVDCECLDQLNLSESELVSLKIKRHDGVSKATTHEDGAAKAGTQDPANEVNCDASAISGQKNEEVKKPVKKPAVKKDIREVWPHGRRLFKDWNDDKISQIFIDCLEILAAGHFELLVSASFSEFEQNKLRVSNTEKRESVMMSNIFKFVSQRLSKEKEDVPGSSDHVSRGSSRGGFCWDAGNFWTDSKNASSVAEFFSRNKGVEEQRQGCRRINVDPARCGRALGFCTQNMLHFLEKNLDVLDSKMTDQECAEDEIVAAAKEAREHLEKVRRCVIPIVNFVCSLPSPIILGNRMLELPAPQSRRRSKQRASRGDKSLPELASVPSSGAAVAAAAIVKGQGRIRSEAQIVEEPLSLPNAQQCGDFQRNICAVQDAGSFVVLIERLCCADESSIFSKNVSSATLFAVFSFEETSLGKVPLVVLPCVGTEQSDMVQYTLGSPVFFNQRRPCRESWAVVTGKAVKDKKRVNTEKSVFWFVDAVVKQQVLSVLQSDGMVEKWKQCLSYERLFRKDNIGSPHDETTWMIEAGPAGASLVAGDFRKGFIQAQMLVQLAVAVNSQELQLGTWPVEMHSGVLRDRFGNFRGRDLNSVLKSVEQTEAPLAFCVELLNVPSLRTIMQGDSSERPSCVSVCSVVLDKVTGSMSDVQFFVPSWDSGFRCTVNGSFIVMILEKEDVEQKFNLLTLVPRIDGRSEAMQKQMQCRSVIQGSLLARYASHLWGHMTSNLVSIRRFSSRQLPMAPSAFLDVFPWHGSTHAWSLEQELTSLKVPGNGDCWITSMLVSAAILAWSKEAEAWPTNDGWVHGNAPVVNMVRQCVASVLFTIQDEFVKTYGDNCDVASLLFEETQVQARWKDIIARKRDFNPWIPGNYGGEPEMAVLAWLIQVNFNVLTSKGQSWGDLNQEKVRAYHFDRSAQPFLTLTGRMPPLQERSSCDEELPKFCDFVRFTVKLDQNKPPRFYELFAFVFHPKDADVPFEHLSVVIAKQLLQAKFCETAEMSSVFIVHNGEIGKLSHFDSIMSCREKPLRLPPAERLNVITHRLNFGATTFVRHLLEVALGIYLEDGDHAPGENLFTVHCCRENETVMEVCKVFDTTYNIGICVDDIHNANIDALAPPLQGYLTQGQIGVSSTGSIASGNSANAFRKQRDRLKGGFRLLVPLKKEWFRDWLKEAGSLSEMNHAKKKHFHSAMTMMCHQAGLEAKRLHHDARVHVFGYLESVQAHEGVVINSRAEEKAHSFEAAIVVSAMTKKLNEIDSKDGKKADSESSNVGSSMVVDTTIEIASVVSAMFQVYTSLQRLVSFLCQGTEEANDYVAGCAMLLVAGKGLFGPGTLPSDLWRAAFYAHCSTRFQITHGYLSLPIRATIVPASRQEFYGTVDNKVEVRERKIKPDRSKVEDVRLPRLLHYISLHGGWGVFTLENNAQGHWLTEYGGRVVEQAEATRMIKAGEATHLRTVNGMTAHIDGRVRGQWDMNYYVTGHMVRFGNRFSFSFLHSRWLYGIMTMGYMFCNSSAVFSTTIAEVLPPLRPPSTLVWTPRTSKVWVTTTRMKAAWNVSM